MKEKIVEKINNEIDKLLNKEELSFEEIKFLIDRKNEIETKEEMSKLKEENEKREERQSEMIKSLSSIMLAK